MPVATVPEVLSPMLLGRLQAALPPEHLEPVVRELSFLLTSVENVPPVTSTDPPLDKTNPWSMAKVFQWLTEPGLGAEQGPLSSCDQHTAKKVHYLYEVQVAPALQDATTPGIQRPQSAIHARLLNEVRREFSLLPLPKPEGGWERAVHDVAARLMVKSMMLGLQPTEVVVVGSQELPPVPGRHQGGLLLHLAGWNGAAPPPEHSDETANPNVWDPSNPLGNEPDLTRAPLKLEWMGIKELPPK